MDENDLVQEETLRRELWNERLQISFRLANDQLEGNRKPKEIVINVRRNTYFSFIFDSLRNHFAPFVKQELRKQDIRVFYSGLPLKLHYPIGVSYDLFVCDGNFPWRLTIQFEPFFSQYELLINSQVGALRNYFWGKVKDAYELKHQGKVVRKFTQIDRDNLWEGFLDNDYDQFWKINQKLMTLNEKHIFPNIPFWLYQLDKFPIENSFAPLNPSNEFHTLQDLITKFAPETLPYSGKLVPLTHGYEVPRDTPLQYLSEIYSYPDNYVHICLIPQT